MRLCWPPPTGSPPGLLPPAPPQPRPINSFRVESVTLSGRSLCLCELIPPRHSLGSKARRPELRPPGQPAARGSWQGLPRLGGGTRRGCPVPSRAWQVRTPSPALPRCQLRARNSSTNVLLIITFSDTERLLKKPTLTTPVLQMGKPRHGTVPWPTPGRPAGTWMWPARVQTP